MKQAIPLTRSLWYNSHFLSEIKSHHIGPMRFCIYPPVFMMITVANIDRYLTMHSTEPCSWDRRRCGVGRPPACQCQRDPVVLRTVLPDWAIGLENIDWPIIKHCDLIQIPSHLIGRSAAVGRTRNRGIV